MRRFVLACFATLTAGAAACGNNAPSAPPDLVTIQGQVLQGSIPANGALIYAVDHSQIAAATIDASLALPLSPVIADGTGHFAIFGFGTSYDLAISPSGSPLDITIVRNLTERAPLITLDAVPNAPTYSCHIATTWSAPPPSGATLAYFLQGPAYPGVELVAVKPTDGNYQDGVDASWRGSYSTSANLWVVAFTKDPSTGLPTAWNGSAAAPIGLIDQRSIPFFTVLQPITTSTINVQVQAPAAYAVDSVDVSLDFGTGTALDIAHFDAAAAASSPLTVLVPDLPYNRLRVRGVAHDGGAISFGVATPAVAYPNQVEAVTLTFAAASQLTSPIDGATGVGLADAISWSGDGVNELSFFSTAPGSPSLRVLTTESSFSLGALPRFPAAQFAAGTSVTWTAVRYPDVSTTDGFEAKGFDRTFWRSASSPPRTFTTATP